MAVRTHPAPAPQKQKFRPHRRLWRLFRLFAILALLAAAVVAYKLPVLWQSLDAQQEIVEGLKPIELEGPVLFVSDIQITSPEQRYTPDLDGIHTVVILGDFFESPDGYRWQFGNTDRERLKAGLDTFIPPSFTGDVYWVSAHNHDPQLPLLEYDYGNLTFRHIGKAARFEIDGLDIVATHGEWFFAGALGGGVSRTLDVLGQDLLLERIGRRKLDLPEDTWLFGAHSHVPSIDYGAKTANTGSFVGVPFNAFWRVHVGTGLRVEDGEVQLVHLW